MVYLDINKTNHKTKDSDLVKELDHYLGNKRNKCFVLFYMEGCGPCAATRPEWAKLENVLSQDILHNDDIVVASIDHELCEKLENLKSKPPSFPTMRFITNGGNEVENYEDSKLDNKDRSVDSFVEWIKMKSREKKQGGAKTRRKYKNKRGGKWSAKYKRSIDCKRPKGFSQRQHCKYGRKK